MPIDRMVRTRIRTLKERKINKNQIKEDAITEWKSRLDIDITKALWTRRLIKNIKALLNRKHCNVEYWLFHFLSIDIEVSEPIYIE